MENILGGKNFKFLELFVGYFWINFDKIRDPVKLISINFSYL